MSAITRVPKTIYHDNKVGGIQWTKDDALALDGNRLFVVNTYNNDSVEYKTEIDNNARIVGYNITTRGPSKFIIYNRDGSKLHYTGEYAPYKRQFEGDMDLYRFSEQVDRCRKYTDYDYDEHAENPETYTPITKYGYEIGNWSLQQSITNSIDECILTWNLTKIEDKYKNYVEYEYTYTETEDLVKELENKVSLGYYNVECSNYTYIPETYGMAFSNTISNSSSAFKVYGSGLSKDYFAKDFIVEKISYGNRHKEIAKVCFHYGNRTKPISGYIAGYKREQNKRLNSIEVISTYKNATKLKTYQLNYKSGEDKLASVGLEGMDNTKLKETELIYNKEYGSRTFKFSLDKIIEDFPVNNDRLGHVINSIVANYDNDPEDEKLIVLKLYNIDHDRKWFGWVSHEINDVNYYLAIYNSDNELICYREISEKDSKSLFVLDVDKDGVSEIFITHQYESLASFYWRGIDYGILNGEFVELGNHSFSIPISNKNADITTMIGDFNGDGDIDYLFYEENVFFAIKNSRT